MSRLPTIAAITVLETTAISLLLLTLGLEPLPWVVLLLVLLAGAGADWQIGRVAQEQQRRWLAGAALAVALAAVAVRVGGVGVALLALLPGSGSPLFGPAYGTLLVALFAFWCGTRVASHTGASIAQAFSLGVFVAIIGLLVAPLLGSLDDTERVRRITIQLLLLVGSGLLAQALVRAEEESEGERRRWGWRWLATFGLAVGGVMLLGLAASSLFGGPAAALLEILWGGLMIIMIVIMLPLLLLLGWLVDVVVRSLGLPPSSRPPLDVPPLPTFSENAQSLFPNISAWAFNAIAALTALLPLLLLLLLILFARRRRKLTGTDEERESLLSWSTVTGDLLGLFRGWRRPFAGRLEGLRAALAALSGGDPASRVRRAYVRMLLALEGRERPRPPAATPAEYAPTARDSFPAAAPAVGTLTHAYERARYGPAPSAEDAAAAERAWAEVERQSE